MSGLLGPVKLLLVSSLRACLQFLRLAAVSSFSLTQSVHQATTWSKKWWKVRMWGGVREGVGLRALHFPIDLSVCNGMLNMAADSRTTEGAPTGSG